MPTPPPVASPPPARARRGVAITVAVAAAIAAGAVGAAASPAFADDTKRLEAGEIVVRTFAVKGSELPRATAKAVIDAPIEKVWAIIDQCKDYKRTMVRVLESAEVERKGNTVTCRIKVDMPWPIDDLAATTRATHTVEAGRRYRRAWTLVSGDYERNDGSWTLTPWGDKPGRTLASYEVLAVPKMSVPIWIQKKAARSALPDLMEKLRAVTGARR